MRRNLAAQDGARAVTADFCESFLDQLISVIDERHVKNGQDLSQVALVFGGKRPALFLKRALAKHFGRAFVPPQFFTIDEWIRHLVQQKEAFTPGQDLDQCYLIYHLAQDTAPEILKGRSSFAQFLPWARQILAFIDLLDLEQVADGSLKNIQAAAQIGYAVPADINRLLERVVALRQVYHAWMLKNKIYSRGFQYQRAAELVDAIALDEFREIFFCNLFYLHQTEKSVIKNLHDRKKAMLVFQGDERRWPILFNLARELECSLREAETIPTPRFQLKLYSAFDSHSQVAQVREILKDLSSRKMQDGTCILDHTVIVLPDPQQMIPLLSEISGLIKDFNVSMGYPLKRSSFYSLFQLMFDAQSSRQEQKYYTRDYLRTLRHPFVKSLNVPFAPAARVLIHKIEEILTGQEMTSLSGSIFLDLHELYDLGELYELTTATLSAMNVQVTQEQLKHLLAEIHQKLFQGWEDVANFHMFAERLEEFLSFFLEKSSLQHYPLNLKIVARMLELKQEMASFAFGQEKFAAAEIFRIFSDKVEREMVAFSGSPLKGLQILGLLETRALNFEHVIMLDVNENILPHLNICDPFIPREVMVNLSLDRLEIDEEIQRYQFMRLISSAQEVHLVYQERADKERSRFVEELIWEKEKALKQVDISYPNFTVKVHSAQKRIFKTPAMIEILKNYTYSSSSINLYLRDPLAFYYQYVLGLREKEDLLEEPENRHIGTFLHGVLEEAFKPYVGRPPQIDDVFRKRFKKIFHDRFEATLAKAMRADAFLLKSVMETRMERFLQQEAEHPLRQVKEILFIEKKFEDRISLNAGKIKFVYRIDRVDRLRDGTVMVLDYKTGSVDPMPKMIDKIEQMEFSRESILENVRSFQMPLYFLHLDQHFSGENINAAFYNLRTLELDCFLKEHTAGDRARLRKGYLQALDHVVNEILDPGVPFDAPTDLW